jgi:hypothetical protein
LEALEADEVVARVAVGAEQAAEAVLLALALEAEQQHAVLGVDGAPVAHYYQRFISIP